MTVDKLFTDATNYSAGTVLDNKLYIIGGFISEAPTTDDKKSSRNYFASQSPLPRVDITSLSDHKSLQIPTFELSIFLNPRSR